jgi:DnaA-homolog protein
MDRPGARGEGLMRQLPLAVQLRDSAVFETFEPGPNGAVVAMLRAPSTTGPAAWIWGPPGTGKSHLLQAACAARPGAAYLPLCELMEAGPAVLEGWEDRPLVCLDDIDGVAGDAGWELAAFALFNRLWERGRTLVVSAGTSPAATAFSLADLSSRLAWGGVFRLEPLSDEDRVAAMRRRARHRGLELPVEAAHYLLRRLPRDMRELCGWLDRLDTASLAAGKRLTLPFVKSVIEAEPGDPPASAS